MLTASDVATVGFYWYFPKAGARATVVQVLSARGKLVVRRSGEDVQVPIGDLRGTFQGPIPAPRVVEGRGRGVQVPGLKAKEPRYDRDENAGPEDI